MKTACSDCGRKLGFLSSKYKLPNGKIYCSSCYSSMKAEEVFSLMQRYLKNKSVKFIMNITSISKIPVLSDLMKRSNLVEVKNRLQLLLQSTKAKNKRGITSSELDGTLSQINLLEDSLDFLDDFEKLHKLLMKKDFEISYSELYDFFVEEIESRIKKHYDKLTDAAYIRISKRLKKEELTQENVIRELIKIPSSVVGEITTEMIKSLLDRFGIKYKEYDLDNVIHQIKEEVELEKFERNLGQEKKVKLGDFSSLDGYQFEDYLKDLFKYLGYEVIKTPVSGDQGADLILVKDGEKTVVQVKKHRGKISNKAVQEVVASKKYYKADKAMIVTNSFFTEGAIRLAVSNDLVLWDGEKLKSEIKKLEKEPKTIASTYRYDMKPEDKGFKTIRASCPFCGGQLKPIKVDLSDLSKKQEDGTKITCPMCGMSIKVKLKVESWRCEFCSKKFKTKKEAEEHEKVCEKRRT